MNTPTFNTLSLNPEPLTDFVFYDADNKEVGRLHLHPPMTFEGDADQSAKIFFEAVIKHIKAQH